MLRNSGFPGDSVVKGPRVLSTPARVLTGELIPNSSGPRVRVCHRVLPRTNPPRDRRFQKTRTQPPELCVSGAFAIPSFHPRAPGCPSPSPEGRRGDLCRDPDALGTRWLWQRPPGGRRRARGAAQLQGTAAPGVPAGRGNPGPPVVPVEARQRGVIDRHRPRPGGLRSGACTGWSDLLSDCRSGAPQAPARPAGHPAGVEKPLAPRERHRHASGAARPRAEHRALAPALRPAVARGEPR